MTPQVNEYWRYRGTGHNPGKEYRVKDLVQIKMLSTKYASDPKAHLQPQDTYWIDGVAYHEKHLMEGPVKDAPVYVRTLSDFLEKFEPVE